MWCEYFQSLVGDEYHENDKLCCHILIEADSCEEANNKAQSMGIQFIEDCEYENSDCRWSKCYYELTFPSFWDEMVILDNPLDYCHFIFKRRHKITKVTKVHSRIFYKDGTVKEVG